MTCVLTLIVIRDKDDNGKDKDDTIRFTSCESRPDVVDISTSFYGKSCDFQYKTSMNRERCPHYALSLVRSLIKDNDPFDCIQINSSLFPSVIYRIEDLVADDSNLFNTIRDIIHVTFDSIIKYIPSKAKVEETDME